MQLIHLDNQLKKEEANQKTL